MATYQSLKQRPLSAAFGNVATGDTQAEEDDSDRKHPTKVIRNGRAWETGVLKRFPWSAGAACLLAVLCTAACIGVLAAANGSPVSQWRVAPPVILAILAAVVNASLSFALAEAVNYRWWIQALEGGSTLSDLERVWMYGTNFGSALTAGKHVNLIAVASVVVTILAIDGPLLQRALSTNVSDINVHGAPINVTLADQIPLGYSGLELISSGLNLLGSALVREQFQEVIQKYQQREPIISQSLTGCYGVCTGEIEGAGLQADCTETTNNKSWFTPRSGNESTSILYGDEALVPSPGETFSVAFAWSGNRNSSKPARMQDFRPLFPAADGRPPNEPFMYMNLTWSTNGTIPDVKETGGTQGLDKYTNFIHQKKCRLYPGSAKYSVVVKSSVTSSVGKDQALASNTIELKGSSKFLPDSFQNTPRLISDAINTTMNEFGQIHRFSNVSDLALPSPPDRFTRRKPYNKDSPDDGPQIYGTLSGLAAFLQNSFGSQAYIRNGYAGGAAWEVGTEPPPDGNEKEALMVAETSGSLVSQFMRKESPSLQQSGLSVPILLFDDPSSFMLSVIDELMLRIAVQTAFDNTFGGAFNLAEMSTWRSETYNTSDGLTSGSTTVENVGYEVFNGTRFPSRRIVNMEMVQSVQVYKASYPFLGGAIAMILLAAILVVPLFHGFWRLGRQTSMGPFETATAMGAPLLADIVSSNSTASELMKNAGMQRVRYGVLNVPQSNDALQGEEKECDVAHRRLQLGRVAQIEKPMRGMIYS